MSERDQNPDEPTEPTAEEPETAESAAEDEPEAAEPEVESDDELDDDESDESDDDQSAEEELDGESAEPETEPDGEPEEPAAADDAAVPEEPADSTEDTDEPEATDQAPAKDHGKQVANALIGVLSLVLGFALAIQVRATSSGEGLDAARQEDLVSILDDLDSREDRLRDEIASLEDSRTELATGDDKTQAALDEAQNRAEDLGILAGTLPAQGPGIVLTISDPEGTVAPEVVLDAIQELRAAGAEAMQIGDVRIGVTTAFTGQKGAVVVDGTPLTSPYVVLAIGDPQTLSTALSIPGGMVATVRRAGGEVTVESQDEVVVSALRPIETPEFAEPTQPTD